MVGNIPKPSEVDANNIQKPCFEQLSAEHQKSLDDIKSKIKWEKDQEIQGQEQEALKYYMPHFSVDWQRKVMKIKYVTFDSSRFELKTNVSKQPALETEISNMVHSAVIAQKMDFVYQNIRSMFDDCFSWIEA